MELSAKSLLDIKEFLSGSQQHIPVFSSCFRISRQLAWFNKNLTSFVPNKKIFPFSKFVKPNSIRVEYYLSIWGGGGVQVGLWHGFTVPRGKNFFLIMNSC